MSTLNAAFGATARLLRKVNRSKRFDRARAAKALEAKTLGWWTEGLEALWEHLDSNKAWDTIHRHTRLEAPESVRKELSLVEKRLIAELLSGFEYYSDAESEALAILAATTFDTFEAAAKFALGQIGVTAADFTLKNEAIKTALLERKDAAIFATKRNIDSIMEAIVKNFYDLGRNPYDAAFLSDLRSELGDVTIWQAKRFALTETAIAAEMAQHETWTRNGVQRTQWNIRGDRTRPSHARMDGVQASIDKGFALASDDGNVYECAGPSDKRLPPHELINCHCWSTPVVNDDFPIDASRIWEGD